MRGDGLAVQVVVGRRIEIGRMRLMLRRMVVKVMVMVLMAVVVVRRGRLQMMRMEWGWLHVAGIVVLVGQKMARIRADIMVADVQDELW